MGAVTLLAGRRASLALPGGRLAPPQAAGTPSAGGVELAAGRAQAGAHRQVPAAGGAADAARHRPGARHAEVPADDPASGAADTCGAERCGSVLVQGCRQLLLPASQSPPTHSSLAQSPFRPFYSPSPSNTIIPGHSFL